MDLINKGDYSCGSLVWNKNYMDFIIEDECSIRRRNLD